MDIERAQRHAVKRGGRLVSTVLNGDGEKVLWECREGHRWESTPNNTVYMKRWCPKCYRDGLGSGEKKEVFLRWLSENGYIAISEYVNRVTKVVIQCGRGHVWNVRPMNIVEKTKCPYCSGRIPTAEKLDELIMERKWFLIGEYIEDHNTRMLFRCERGHTVKASFDEIRRGKKCRACVKLDKPVSKTKTHYDHVSERQEGDDIG